MSHESQATSPLPEENTMESNTDAGQAESQDPEQRIAALQAECEELRSNWQRAQADYQNARRRALSEVEAGVRRALQPLLDGLLTVLDNLDMALAAPTESEEAKNLAIGVELTRRQLAGALEGQAVEPIPTGGKFDPERHQAVSQVPSADHAPGEIVETLRLGYTWRGGVLRYAQVVVAAEKE